MSIQDIIRCERCLLFKPLGKYTKYETHDIGGMDIGEKRALCKDCVTELAKKDYDFRHDY